MKRFLFSSALAAAILGAAALSSGCGSDAIANLLDELSDEFDSASDSFRDDDDDFEDALDDLFGDDDD